VPQRRLGHREDKCFRVHERLPDNDLVRARRAKLAQVTPFFNDADGRDLGEIDLDCAIELELVKQRVCRCKGWLAVFELQGAEPGLHFLGANPTVTIPFPRGFWFGHDQSPC